MIDINNNYMQLETLLLKSLQNISQAFLPDELAYLALTSKIEIPIRDKLAYLLTKSLKDSIYMVGREWNRADLVILNKSKPELICELKAMYSFNGIEANRQSKVLEYIEKLGNDLKKTKSMLKSLFKEKQPAPGIYNLLLATHLRKEVPDSQLKHIVKYVKGINKAFEKNSNKEEEIIRLCKINLDSQIEEHSLLSKARVRPKYGAIDAGEIHGIPIQIYYWLLGPYSINSIK